MEFIFIMELGYNLRNITFLVVRNVVGKFLFDYFILILYWNNFISLLFCFVYRIVFLYFISTFYLGDFIFIISFVIFCSTISFLFPYFNFKINFELLHDPVTRT